MNTDEMDTNSIYGRDIGLFVTNTYLIIDLLTMKYNNNLDGKCFNVEF